LIFRDDCDIFKDWNVMLFWGRIWHFTFVNFQRFLMCLVALDKFVAFDNQVGNVGGKEFSESLAPDVQKLLVRAHCS
jgi:hypothetical protein